MDFHIFKKIKQEKLENIIDKDICNSFFLAQILEEDKKKQQRIQQDFETLVTAKLMPWIVSDIPMFNFPDKKTAKGEYPIGFIPNPESNKAYSFCIQESEMLRHVLVVGSTGSGKTNTIFLLIRHFLRCGKPFLVFDWKRNYRDLLCTLEAREKQILTFTVGRELCPFHFNPLIPPKGTSPSVWLSKLIEIMCHAYFLGEGVIYVLSRAIHSVYRDFGVYESSGCWPTFRNILYYLENYKSKGRETQWLASSLRAVATLCFGEMNRILNLGNYSLAKLLNENVILELDALTDSAKIFLIESLLLWFHHYRMAEGKRETFKHACIIEEAHHILSRKTQQLTGTETITDIIMREIREFGESIIVVDQDPSLLSIPALGNTYATICMNLKERRDVNLMSSVLLLDSEDKKYLTKLEVGQAIVKLQGRHTDPFLINIPKVDIQKGYVNDMSLEHKMVKFYEKFDKTMLRTKANQEIRQNSQRNKKKEEKEIKTITKRVKEVEDVSSRALVSQIELTSNQKLLLIDTLQNPISKVKQRYKRLKLNDYQGNKAQQKLIEKKLIRTVKLSNPKGTGYWGKTFQLTNKAKIILEGLGFIVNENETKRKGGLRHQHLVKLIVNKLREEGHRTIEEFPLGQGRSADIVVDRKVAIEIERTGKNIVDNIRKNLESGLEVIVACESDLIKEKIEKKLKEAKAAENAIVTNVTELLNSTLTHFIPSLSISPSNSCTQLNEKTNKEVR